MQRYIIENHGPNEVNAKFMICEAVSICIRDGISRITLFVPNKETFPFTVLGKLLADDAKRLCRGHTVLIHGNLSLDLVCASKVSRVCVYGMVIGVYVSPLMLDSIETAKTIMFLPWTEEEGKMWLSTWNATVLGTNTWQVQQTSLPPDVDNALSVLTQGINLSTGLAHPLDRAAARRVLAELRNSGHELSPNDVRTWALQNGWRADAAKDFADEVVSIFK